MPIRLWNIYDQFARTLAPSPSHLVSIAGVQNLFDDNGTCTDPNTETAVCNISTHLLDYIHRHICPGVMLESILREGTAGLNGPHPKRACIRLERLPWSCNERDTRPCKSRASRSTFQRSAALVDMGSPMGDPQALHRPRLKDATRLATFW